jgi:hypothetical protein
LILAVEVQCRIWEIRGIPRRGPNLVIHLPKGENHYVRSHQRGEEARRGRKRRKVEKSGEKWRKVEKVGRWRKVEKGGERWRKVEKGGERWRKVERQRKVKRHRKAESRKAESRKAEKGGERRRRRKVGKGGERWGKVGKGGERRRMAEQGGAKEEQRRSKGGAKEGQRRSKGGARGQRRSTEEKREEKGEKEGKMDILYLWGSRYAFKLVDQSILNTNNLSLCTFDNELFPLSSANVIGICSGIPPANIVSSHALLFSFFPSPTLYLLSCHFLFLVLLLPGKECICDTKNDNLTKYNQANNYPY